MSKIKPILVRESGFLFVKYVDEHGKDVEVALAEGFDFDGVLQEVRDERFETILVQFPI